VPDPAQIDDGLLALAIGTFFIAGIVKGIVGFGLPTIGLAVMAAIVGMKTAIALTVMPALFTNVAQALVGGRLILLLGRLWPMLIMIVIGVFFGTLLLVRADGAVLAVGLGAIMAVYAGFGLAEITLPRAGRAESWLSPIIGTINGVITGLTGTFIVPGILYMQTLGMERKELVQAMGIVFLLSTAALGVFMTRVSLMTTDLAVISLAAVGPAFAGMWVGQQVSKRLSDVGFARAFFCGLLLVGLFLVYRNAG